MDSYFTQRAAHAVTITDAKCRKNCQHIVVWREHKTHGWKANSDFNLLCSCLIIQSFFSRKTLCIDAEAGLSNVCLNRYTCQFIRYTWLELMQYNTTALQKNPTPMKV